MTTPTGESVRSRNARAEPCLRPWGEYDDCPLTASGHTCGRPTEHEGRHRCRYCRATTTVDDPIFEDAEELEAALEEL